MSQASFRLQTAARLAALGAAAIGAGTLAGWALEVHWLHKMGPGPLPMHPFAGLVVLVAGLGSPALGWNRRSSPLTGSLLLALATLMAVARGTGWDPFDAGYNTSFVTVLATALLGLACLGWRTTSERAQDALATSAGVLGLTGVIRNLYGVQVDLVFDQVSWMSLPAGAGIAAASVALLLGRPAGLFARLLTSPHVDGTIARRLLTAALVVPPTLGLVRLIVERAGLVSAELGLTLLITAGMTILGGLIVYTAVRLGRLDRERQAMLARLSHSEARRAEALLIAQLGSWELDPATGYMTWSEECYRVWGMRPEVDRPSVESLFDRLHPDDREAFRAGLTLSADRPHAEVEYRLLHPDEGLREYHGRSRAEIDPEGRVIRVTGTAQDITHRKQAERALLEREQNLAITLRSIGDAVICTDAAGRVTRMNRVAENLTGWRVGEALGRPVAEVFRLVHESTRERVECPAGRVLKEGRVVFLADRTALVRRDGVEHPIADSAAPIRDDQGALIGVVVVFRDVTDEREVAEERERLRVKLVETDRLAGLGVLAAGIAHEINNPLAFVCANLDYLSGEGFRGLSEACRVCKMGGDRDTLLANSLEETRAALEECRVGADRVRRIVSDVRVLSRSAGVDEEEGVSDLSVVIRSSMQVAAHEVERRAQVEAVFEDPPLVRGSPARLGQVVLNLLVNAAQAIPEERRGRVRVGCRATPEGQAELTVTDDGCGIPPQHLPRLFEPFFTTKPQGEGTGLGLAICHGIVTSLGGTIAVESRPGEGTTFRVTLPAATGCSPRPAGVGPRISTFRGRVLVVDDEPLVGRAIRRLLRAHHDVVVVSDPAMAAQRLLAGERFDAVLCDLMMPGTTGVELYRKALEDRPELAGRFVFFTGGATTPELRHFVEQERARCLSKPVEPSELLGALNDLIRRPSEA